MRLCILFDTLTLVVVAVSDALVARHVEHLRLVDQAIVSMVHFLPASVHVLCQVLAEEVLDVICVYCLAYLVLVLLLTLGGANVLE